MPSVERGMCPMSHVHNKRTVPIIMAGCIAHAQKWQNGHMSTSGLKSNFTIVFLDPDLRRENFGDSSINKGYIYCVFFIAHARNGRISIFGLKIWHYHRVPRPRCILRRENFGDSRTFKADIGLLDICMGFQDFLA